LPNPKYATAHGTVIEKSPASEWDASSTARLLRLQPAAALRSAAIRWNHDIIPAVTPDTAASHTPMRLVSHAEFPLTGRTSTHIYTAVVSI